jgi:hypothetical protein
MRWMLMLLCGLSMLFGAEAEGGRRCRKVRCKSQPVYRMRSVNRNVSRSCVGGSCAAPAVTIEKVKTRTVTRGNRQALLEAWCLEECRLQAATGQGHPRGTPGHLGVWFCGTGSGTNSCRPHSGPPQAEVTAYGHTTRVW